MRKILAVAQKELRQIRRDHLTLAMLLGVPALMLLLYGYALNFDVRHVALAVQDLDRSAASREFVAAFVHSGYFDQVEDVPAGAELERLTQGRRARAILVIPEAFGRRLAAGRTGSVQFLLDGTDSNTATTVLGYAQAITRQRNIELAVGSGVPRDAGVIRYRPRVWYNPELNSTHFLVPGLIGFILMLTAVLSTALSVVREKERGTMEQLRVTPLRPPELLLGKTLPYLAISLLAAGTIIFTSRALFGVVVKGPVLDLFAATLVYLIGALGFGLLISSFAGTQAMAFQAGATTSMLPALFLSGFIFPLRGMPEILQAVSYLVPARYYLVILRGIVIKGAGLGVYPEQLGFLVLYAAVVLTLTWIRLVKGAERS